MIYVKMLALAILLSACNPIFGVTSFMHSLATGNTVGIVTGGAGIVVEKQTGKTPLEHVMEEAKEKPKPKEYYKDLHTKHVEWSFENLSTVMNQE